MTTHKSQGDTWAENYSIYQPESFDYNMLFVALTRCRKTSQISIYTDDPESLIDRVFVRSIDKTVRHMTNRGPDDYKIYKITDDTNKFIYVGQTKQALADRFASHCHNSTSGVNTESHAPFDPTTARIELLYQLASKTPSTILTIEGKLINLWAKKVAAMDYRLINKMLVDSVAQPVESPTPQLAEVSTPNSTYGVAIELCNLSLIDRFHAAQTHFKIRDLDTEQRIIVKNKYLTKKIRYTTCGIDSAYKEMIEFLIPVIVSKLDASFKFTV